MPPLEQEAREPAVTVCYPAGLDRWSRRRLGRRGAVDSLVEGYAVTFASRPIGHATRHRTYVL